MVTTMALNGFSRVSFGFQSFYKLRMKKLHKFQAKVLLQTEVGPYLLKTVTDPKELRQALQLRYQIFYQESFIKRGPALGLDMDDYDFNCDHLVIINKKTNEMVGTYRMNCSLFSDQFYSTNEFHMSRILAQPGIKVELGRACIHPLHRNGISLSLLWRGIAEYMQISQAQLLFGCASVSVKNPREAALLHRYLSEQNRMTPEFLAPPTEAFTMPGLDLWLRFFKNPLTESEIQEAQSLIPSLLRTYLKIGAKIGGEPAWDKNFQCIDFLTILRREDLNKTLWRKYKLGSSESLVP